MPFPAEAHGTLLYPVPLGQYLKYFPPAWRRKDVDICGVTSMGVTSSEGKND